MTEVSIHTLAAMYNSLPSAEWWYNMERGTPYQCSAFSIVQPRFIQVFEDRYGENIKFEQSLVRFVPVSTPRGFEWFLYEPIIVK